QAGREQQAYWAHSSERSRLRQRMAQQTPQLRGDILRRRERQQWHIDRAMPRQQVAAPRIDKRRNTAPHGLTSKAKLDLQRTVADHKLPRWRQTVEEGVMHQHRQYIVTRAQAEHQFTRMRIVAIEIADDDHQVVMPGQARSALQRDIELRPTAPR